MDKIVWVDFELERNIVQNHFRYGEGGERQNELLCRNRLTLVIFQRLWVYDSHFDILYRHQKSFSQH